MKLTRLRNAENDGTLDAVDLVPARDAVDEHRASRHVRPLACRPFLGLASLRERLVMAEQCDLAWQQHRGH